MFKFEWVVQLIKAIIWPLLILLMALMFQTRIDGLLEAFDLRLRSIGQQDSRTNISSNSIKLAPIPTQLVNAGEKITFRTNNGAQTVIIINNQSTTNSAHYTLSCGEQLVDGVLPPNQPTNRYQDARDWSGCEMLIANSTSEVVPARINVALIGLSTDQPDVSAVIQ